MATWTITPDEAKIYTLQTAGKYVDRDIEIDLKSNSLAETVTGTAINGSVNPSVTASVSSTKNSAGNYPISGSATISGTTSGTATATITASGFGVKDNTFTGTVTGKISGTASATGSVNPAAATVTGSGTASSPTIAKDTGNVKSTNAITTSKPTTGFYAAAKATAPKTTITMTKTINTKGYLGADSEITASGSISAKTGSAYYIPIDSGTIGVAASDPGTDYTENTTAAVSSGGYLTLSEGYYSATKISLATLIGDDIGEVTTTTASDSMLSGFRAYDKDGNVLLGNIATKTSADLSASGATVTVPAGYYATQATKSISSGSVGALAITASDTAVTVGTTATSGYYPVNVSSLSGTVTITSGYISGNKTVTDSDGGKVGKILAGGITNNTSGGTSTATITSGKQIKIGKGYYPNDLYYTAQSFTQQKITGSLSSAIDSGYTAPSLVDSKATGKVYVSFTGNGSMTTGNQFNGTADGKTQYMEIYTGTYTVA